MTHEEYVASGKCSNTKPGSDGKTWCNAKAGHLGPHWAQRIPTPGQLIGFNNPARVSWE